MKILRVVGILIKGIITIPFRVLGAMFEEEPKIKSPSTTVKFKNQNKSGVPDSFDKGEKFEEFLREKIFTKENYILVHKTHNYQTNSNDFVESSLLPDFKFRCKSTNKEFFVEVKFRTTTLEGKVEWCNQKQFERYKNVNKKALTFLALGYKGSPAKPDEIYVIPISKINYSGLYLSTFDEYRIPTNKNLSNNQFWKIQKI